MTLVFGMAFPMFYMICLFGVVIQYITERYTLAVWYRLPPKFSLDLTELNVYLLIICPIWASGLCFWIIGNQQLFGYQVDEMDSKNQVVLSHHTLGATLARIFMAELTELEAIFLALFLSIVVLYGVSWLIMKQRGILSNQI